MFSLQIVLLVFTWKRNDMKKAAGLLWKKKSLTIEMYSKPLWLAEKIKSIKYNTRFDLLLFFMLLKLANNDNSNNKKRSSS